MTAVYITQSARTSFGRFAGRHADRRPDDLAAGAIDALFRRAPDLDPMLVDGVVWGAANQAGEDNRNVARMAGLLAGVPVCVPATTINRLCGSSLDAVLVASREIEVGEADLMIVGGSDSMSRAPWVLPKPGRGFPAGSVTAESTTLGWRLVNDRMPAAWTMSLGECNELIAREHSVSRERQDEFAKRSHELAAGAWANGFYNDLVFDPDGPALADEGIRLDVSVEKLASVRPAFQANGSITAGNASPLSDGASSVLLASENGLRIGGLTAIARVAGRGVSAVEPQMFGIAPVEAANQALARAGVSWNQVGAVEINEAFAAQSLACLDMWSVDESIVNSRGGAIAIGHPLGASGGRLVGTLAERMRQDDVRWGLAAICIGVGQALAVVLENCGDRA